MYRVSDFVHLFLILWSAFGLRSQVGEYLEEEENGTKHKMARMVILGGPLFWLFLLLRRASKSKLFNRRSEPKRQEGTLIGFGPIYYTANYYWTWQQLWNFKWNRRRNYHNPHGPAFETESQSEWWIDDHKMLKIWK